MKQKSLLILILVIQFSCSGVKKTQEALNSGNYQSAMNKALKNLASNKNKKGNQPYILLLEEAFKKNSERELEHISFLKKNGNPSDYEQIYTSYQKLKQLQSNIKPLLPLFIVDENRTAKFSFNNYNSDIIKSKEVLSNYLYNKAVSTLKSASTKTDFRDVYNDLAYLNTIDPGKKNTTSLLNEVHEKGTDYIMVSLRNSTKQIIPARLEDDLLDFNTYNLDDFWTKYHASVQDNRQYDYEMTLDFSEINISPERIREKEISKEREIEDGYTYARNNNGAYVKDSLGNKIKVKVLKKVQCTLYQITQNKEVQVRGKVKFRDLQSGQLLDSYPLSSIFVFEHIYANYDGNILALPQDYVDLTKSKVLPFPSNEQMVYDAGEDLKKKLKSIIKNHRF